MVCMGRLFIFFLLMSTKATKQWYARRYGSTKESRLARRTTQTGLGPQSPRLATKQDCRSSRREQRGGESMAQARARRRGGGPAGPSPKGSDPSAQPGAKSADSLFARQGSPGVRVSGRCVDGEPGGRGNLSYLRGALSP